MNINADSRGAHSIAPETSRDEYAEALTRKIDQLDLPEVGKAYVEAVASSPPSRKIGKHRVRNMIADVPIPELQVLLQAESASGEYFFLLEMMHRRDVVAVYDQPQAVPLSIVNRRGIRTKTTYTPDFLVVHSDRIVVYEIKADDALTKNCQERSNDWVCEQGSFTHRPARDYFAMLGIEHVVVPNSKTSAVRADNLRMLLAARHAEDSDSLAVLRRRIEKIVRRVDLIQIGNVLDQLGVEDTTAVMQLIDQGVLYADLDRCLLSSPRKLWISTSEDLLDLPNDIGFPFHSVIVEKNTVSTNDLPDPRHVCEVASRFAACGFIDQSEGLKEKSERSKRRYKQDLRKSDGDRSVLFPRWANSGNRAPRLAQNHLELLDSIVIKTRADPNLSSAANGYLEYLSQFEEAMKGGQDRPVARSTFYRRFRRFSLRTDLAMRRGGRRAFNAAASPVDPQRRTLIPTRAFSIAHIDHYAVDVALSLGTEDGQVISKRAWLTGMVDAYTGEVLGLWISYEAPSRHSCAMVIRDCVRRHHRLPEILVVDGGPEFDSVHFTTLLASLGVTRFERPPEDPKFGKEIERLFGTFKEKFARGLPGFIPPVADARKTSGKWKAAARAKLNIQDLIELLEVFTFSGYNQENKPGCLESRAHLRNMCDKAFPFSGKKVTLDLRFLIQTAVDAPAECYRLQVGRGIRVYGISYSCPALLAYRGPKKSAYVRVEPFDSSIVYACLNHEWHVCRSSTAAINDALHSSEVIARTEEKRHLRNLIASLALEAEKRTYQLKKDLLTSIIDKQEQFQPSIGIPNGEQRQSSTPKCYLEKMEHIEDLQIEEDPT
ncbi:TnsA endonuclease N-terminal domain-containing protein [Dyella sp. C11]|uniref:TnsA endonuclease N-terminal domain-containing protein n=1 Tax=Dyella sp. C11 TaxID=2126991 RepID=UPI000D65BF1E|nr:TnsA endonuclease N-terminal domain-containing protein [Dyella sp. C11]